MMRLLSGVALAALIAAPVWAQTPTSTPTPNAQAPSAQAPATTQNMPAKAGKSATATSRKKAAAMAPRKHRAMGHAMRTPRHRMRYAGAMHRTWWHAHRYGWYHGWGPAHAPTDFMAQRLNRQELGQIYSGGGMPPVSAQPSGY